MDLKVALQQSNLPNNMVSLREINDKSDIEAKKFANSLTKATFQNHMEDLKHLVKQIDEKAARLAKSCTIADLKAYKRAVQDFVQETVKRCYRAQNQGGWDGFGRSKILVIVRRVDEKLEQLSREILEGQKESLQVLEKTGEIRGLLVDLYT